MANNSDMTVEPVIDASSAHVYIQSVLASCDIEIFWACVSYLFSGLLIIHKLLVFFYRLPRYLKVTKPWSRLRIS